VRGRVLIWGATMERLASTQPLAFADGRRDRLARLRPWIGFGPESFTAALLPFYPPELAHIEKEHPIPDRAHNDLLDAAVAGGLLGLLAQVGMVTAALVLGGVRLGLGSAPRLAAAIGAGGLGGLALAWLLWGRALAAVGLGLGLVVGFGVMLVAAAWRRRRDAPDTRPGEGPVLAGVLAALVGHVVETQFGLATVSTRLVAAALVGWLVAWGATRSAPPEGPSFRAVPAALGLGGLLGLTVAYGFLRIPFGLEFPGTVLLLSAGVAAGLLVLESEPRARLLAVAGSVVGALAIALVLAAGMAWINASAGGLDDTRAAQRLAWLPAILLLAFAAAALIAGLAVVIEGAGPGRVRLALASLVAVAGMAGAMRFWEADVLLAAARRLGDVGEPRASGELFQAAWRLAPFRDAIPAGAARVLIETARITVGEADRDTLLDRADGYLARAIARAPLAWAHAADRARLQLLWAGMTVEPPLRQRRLHEADRHYRATLRLHPRSPAVWNEWALLALASGARDEARLRLGRSLELDPRLDQTHRLLRAAEAPED
jgi:tetratricopeptide (TPR) repeat protein